MELNIMSEEKFHDLINSVIKNDLVKISQYNKKDLIKALQQLIKSRGCHFGPTSMIAKIVGKIGNEEFIVRLPTNQEFLIKYLPSNNMACVKVGDLVALDNTHRIVAKIPNYQNENIVEMTSNCNLGLDFDDIGGCDSIIDKIRTNIELPLLLKTKYPQIFRKIKISIPKGILLEGAPGTGKTLMARILASRLNSNFFHTTGANFVRKFVGDGSRHIDEVFRQAKLKAAETGFLSVIFIDEIDAIGEKISVQDSSGGKEVRRTLTQLLSKMDGFTYADNILVIGATNRIEVIDDALLRPGRFDLIIPFDLPDLKARIKIFQIHLRNVPINQDVNFDKLADITKGFSGAMIAEICRYSKLNFLRRKFEFNSENMENEQWKMNRTVRIELTMEDFENAINASLSASEKLKSGSANLGAKQLLYA